MDKVFPAKTLTVGDLKRMLNGFNDSDEVMLHSIVDKEEIFQFKDEGDYVEVDVPASLTVSHRTPNGCEYVTGQCWIYSKGLLEY